MIIHVMVEESKWPGAMLRARNRKLPLVGIRPGVCQMPRERWDRIVKMVGLPYLDAAETAGYLKIDDSDEQVPVSKAKKAKKAKGE